MNISIFGLGYVGCVGAACLAKFGHHITGVERAENKIDLINQGKPTIIEKEIDGFVKDAHDKGLLQATNDYIDAVKKTEISFICVGTPSTKEGHLNLDYIYEVSRQIGEGIKEKDGFHIVAIRSTVLPGTNQRVGEIIEEISGKHRNKAFAIVSNPEFLREGTSVNDYFNPPYTLIGTDSERAEKVFRELYKDIPAEFITTDKNVKISQLTGTNADFIAAKMPHLHQIITDDLERVYQDSDVLVIANKEMEFSEIPVEYPYKCIIDLVRQYDNIDYDGNYEGISWSDINCNASQYIPRDP